MKQSILTKSHEMMHRIPGMPEHHKAKRLNSRGGLQNRSLQNRVRHNVGFNHPTHEPKILVGWQHKIAQFFGVQAK